MVVQNFIGGIDMAEEIQSVDARRRELLKKAGVGGALVWAAPVVDGMIASPAAAASSNGLCTMSLTPDGTSLNNSGLMFVHFRFNVQCPEAAQYRRNVTSNPPVPGFDLQDTLPDVPTFGRQGYGADCADIPAGGTTVTAVWELLDSGGNVLCSATTGPMFVAACVT